MHRSAFVCMYVVNVVFVVFMLCIRCDAVCVQIAAEREKEAQKQEEERAQTSASVNKAKTEDKPKIFKPGVGKYINMVAT